MKRNETSTSKINMSLSLQDNDLLKDVHKSTDIISSLIHEYLLKRDYTKALDSFQEELSNKIRQKNYYKIAFSNIKESNLLKFFGLGKKNEFFKSWKRIIPNHIRLREPPLQKLEFYIHIYFAIYPLLYRDSEINCNKTIQETMDEFKEFLEKKDSDYSKSNEFLSYYALPYVQNPKTHPSYSKLFQPEWTVELKDKIQLAIKTYLPSIKYPVLYDLINESNANANNGSNLNSSNVMKNFLENVTQEKIERMDEGQNRNDANIEEINRLKEENEIIKTKLENKKYHVINIQKSMINLCLNILSCSFELYLLCKGNRNPNDINLKSGKIYKKLLKFQSFLKKQSNNIEKYTKSSSVNNIALSAIKEQNDEMFENIGSGFGDISGINNSAIGNNSLGINKSFHIDYDQSHLIDINSFQLSVRDEFLNNFVQNNVMADNDLKYGSVIRELRVRSFRRKDIQIRQLSLYSIFYYDLFYKFNLLKEALNRKVNYPNLSLELAKLLSLISTSRKGRNYLLMKPNSLAMVEDIYECMKSEKQDTELRQYILTALQHFTTRLAPTNKLIELGIVKWIIDVFSYEMNTLSQGTYDRGIALLFNLVLNKNGIKKFEEDSERTIQIIVHYLNIDNNDQNQTSINGILYSLVKRKVLREAAKKNGLENIILNSNITKPVNQRQLNYILQELRKSDDVEDENVENNFDEDPNEPDAENEELFDDDDVEMDSIDEKILMMHHKYLSDFIIRNDNQNEEEVMKISNYMQSNPKVLDGENKSKNFGNEINEEININIEDQKDINNDDNNNAEGNASQNKENNEPIKNVNEIYEKFDANDERAFQKSDRIVRTPPGNI